MVYATIDCLGKLGPLFPLQSQEPMPDWVVRLKTWEAPPKGGAVSSEAEFEETKVEVKPASNSREVNFRHCSRLRRPKPPLTVQIKSFGPSELYPSSPALKPQM